ncbi:hypothetical protein BVI1335_1740030 [Burkholderia vietnamiensis]|nr:hypothetical protein BVI1335_1740030 [Burkholderia vietnamiensis]
MALFAFWRRRVAIDFHRPLPATLRALRYDKGLSRARGARSGRPKRGNQPGECVWWWC